LEETEVDSTTVGEVKEHPITPRPIKMAKILRGMRQTEMLKK